MVAGGKFETEDLNPVGQQAPAASVGRFGGLPGQAGHVDGQAGQRAFLYANRFFAAVDDAVFKHAAGNRAGDWSDAIHAAVVGAAIPAVIAAVDSAAHSDDEPKNASVWPKVLVPALVVGAAAAALVVWARRDPGRDTWAGEDDEWEFADDAAFKDQLRDGVNRAADAAVDAAKRATAAAT